MDGTLFAYNLKLQITAKKSLETHDVKAEDKRQKFMQNIWK